MAIIFRGDQVSFLMVGDARFEEGELFELPETFGYVQDFMGEIFRRCDVFFVPIPPKVLTQGLSHSDTEMQKAFKKYYGDDEECVKVAVDIPARPWRLVGYARTFRYRRYGHLRGLYTHDYAEPQPVFQCGKGKAYKVSHPDWCVINERGVVHP